MHCQNCYSVRINEIDLNDDDVREKFSPGFPKVKPSKSDDSPANFFIRYEIIRIVLNFLYLASKSISRQMLLKQAGIQFKLIDQSADENVAFKKLSLQEVVSNIALKKMEHSILLDGVNEGEEAFVLSADTMGRNNLGEIFGKPGSKRCCNKNVTVL